MDPSSSPSRPNVLLIMTDDLTWGDLGCHGNTVSRTPALDQLYRQSTHLMRHYAAPCEPLARRAHDRALPLPHPRHRYLLRALHDGPRRAHARGNPARLRLSHGTFWQVASWGLLPHATARQRLRRIPRACGAGGLGAPGNPTANDGYFNPDLRRNGKVVPSQGYCTDIFADETIAFIERNRHQPFFAFLATNAPHNPLLGKLKMGAALPRKRDQRTPRSALWHDRELDMNIGRVLTRLDELDLDSNTIVIFTSDHGWCRSTLHNGQHRFNGGLRDGKGSMYNAAASLSPLFLALALANLRRRARCGCDLKPHRHPPNPGPRLWRKSPAGSQNRRHKSPPTAPRQRK